jgi:hypothetical protein
VPPANGISHVTAHRGSERGVRLEAADGTVVTCAEWPGVLGEALAVEPLRHGLGNTATRGIWRIHGTAGSAVLKVAGPPSQADPAKSFPAGDEPTHWNYWRREALAYQTGLAGTAYASGGITAPALLAASTLADGAAELWLADVSGTAGFDWPVPRLARFAYELGAAQARWAGRVPETPWLSRRWLPQYLAEGPPRLFSVRASDWDHPSVAVWPAQVRRELQRLWADPQRPLAAALAAERTLCHLDVWPANLVDDAGASVLLDWSFAGEGAVGEDAANLILDSCADGLMDVALLREIAETVTDGYTRGLRDAGWPGSPDSVRAAIAASGAAKYSWFAPAVITRAIRDHLGPSSYGQDRSPAEAVRRVTPLVALIAEWAHLSALSWPTSRASAPLAQS